MHGYDVLLRMGQMFINGQMGLGLILMLAGGVVAWGEGKNESPTTLPATNEWFVEPTTNPVRLAPPNAAQTLKAERILDELCRKQGLFAATRDAARLRELARGTNADAPLRYVALVRAMEVAGAAGQAQLAQQILAEIVEGFYADPHVLGLKIVRQLQGGAYPQVATTLAMRLLDDALAARRLDMAMQLADILRRNLPGAAEEQQGAIKEQLADCEYARKLSTRATSVPSSSSAQYDFLYCRSWNYALLYLAQGKDEMAKIASDDLSATEMADRLKVADRWWALGEARGGKIGWRIAARAVAIYANSLSKLEGVARELAFMRTAVHQRQQLAWQGIMPGLVLQISGGGKDAKPQRSVVKFLEFDADKYEVPRNAPRVTLAGQLLVDMEGKYEITFTAGTGLRVRVDGELVLDDAVAYRKRAGEKITLDLKRGLHHLEVEVWANSSKPRLAVSWTTPLSDKPGVLEPGCLYHDSLGADGR